jgi:O-acetyl-ADP-ribose deacetylase (regulator of RNase III)
MASFQVVLSVRADDAHAAFQRAFAGVPAVRLTRDDICRAAAGVDCLATPGNSFGRMDGGADGSINTLLSAGEAGGGRVHERVQRFLVCNYFGEQPVGTCVFLPVTHPSVQILAHVPTMRVPEDVSQSLNAYLAFRALLVEIMLHNQRRGGRQIHAVACTPFCTGAGCMSHERAAAQMRAAWDSVMHVRPPLHDWAALHRGHRALRGENLGADVFGPEP